MTMTIASLAPIKINSTVIAVKDVQFSPDIAYMAEQHSGYEFPSLGVVPGAAPRIRFKTPLTGAYSLIGMKLLIGTTFELYFATFASGLRQSGANHKKLNLNTSATVCAYIVGGSVGQNGVVWVDVEVVGLSADGVVNPFQITASVSLPTLSSEPQLHTMGPYALNGTRKDGASNLGFQTNVQLATTLNDGDSFPRSVGWMGAAPELAIEHQDALTVLGDLGLTGLNLVTSAAIFFCGIDPTTQLRQTTGFSFTVSSGRALPGPVTLNQGQLPRQGIMIKPLSATSTHPLVVATAATVP